MSTTGRELLVLIESFEVNLAWVVALAVFAGLSLAWAIGANDVANTFGTSVGAKVLSVRQAIIAAAIFEFLGAFLMGSQVADTLRDGILIPEQYEKQPAQLAVGMTASMLGAWFLIFLATACKLPVSATHAVIGAVMGFAVMAQGIDGVIWEEIGFIILSWVTSPVVAGTIAFTLFFTLRQFVLRAPNSFERGLYIIPMFYAVTMTFNMFFITFKGSGGGFVDLSVIPVWGVVLLSVSVGYLTGFFAFLALPFLKQRALINAEERKVIWKSKDDPTSGEEESDTSSVTSPSPAVSPTFEAETFAPETEQLFAFLQILTACFGSFAHGANDVANAIGPFAVIISVYQTGSIDQESPIPWWVLAGGGAGIVLGLATWGYKVMATIGENLCKVTPSRGFNIELASAFTVLTGSKIGIPLSTTHCQVGGVVGVGLTEGRNAVNWLLVLQVFGGWVITLPVAAGVSAVLYLFLWNLFIYYIPV